MLRLAPSPAAQASVMGGAAGGCVMQPCWAASAPLASILTHAPNQWVADAQRQAAWQCCCMSSPQVSTPHAFSLFQHPPNWPVSKRRG